MTLKLAWPPKGDNAQSNINTGAATWIDLTPNGAANALNTVRLLRRYSTVRTVVPCSRVPCSSFNAASLVRNLATIAENTMGKIVGP